MFLFMVMAVLSSGVEPTTIPEDPQVVFYVMKDLIRKQDTKQALPLYRLFQDGKEFPACLMYETSSPISPNVAYLPVIRLVATTIESRETNDWTLRISDLAGKTFKEVRGVNDQFSANTDGSKIVYMTGKTRSEQKEAKGIFVSTGTWIMDVDSGQSERIFPEGQDVYWSKKEDCIFISPEVTYDVNNRFDVATNTFDKKILRYDLKTRQVTPTKYGTCRFSSNETYYLALDGGFSIHKTATNENVAVRIPALKDAEIKKPLKWLSDTSVISGDLLINCEENTVRCLECKWYGTPDILGLVAESGTLLVRTEDHWVEKVPLAELPEIKPKS